MLEPLAVRIRAGLLPALVAMLLLGCTGQASPPTPASTGDPLADLCTAEVHYASLNPPDPMTALDWAIRDCASVAMLKDALATHAGGGNVDLDGMTPETFAARRCRDPAANLASRRICLELGARP